MRALRMEPMEFRFWIDPRTGETHISGHGVSEEEVLVITASAKNRQSPSGLQAPTTKEKPMSPNAKNQYPAGWDEPRVQEAADYYDNQTDEEIMEEDEAAMAEGTVMVVPPELVIEIEKFIARRQNQRGKKKPRAR